MTREEAKEILTHNWTRVDNPNYSESELDEAFFMAIEALQTDAEHDGCDGCRYEHNTEYEYPCSECKQNHVDMWEQKPNDFIEVVRCKDCRYSFYDKDYESYNCRKHEYVELFDADDYCSWGERND